MQIMFRCFQNVLIVLALAGLFVSSWGACTTFTGLRTSANYYTCGPNTYTLVFQGVGCSNSCLGQCRNLNYGSDQYSANKHCVLVSCEYNNGVVTQCDTQVEADSVACVNSGSNWVNGQCKNCDASDPSTWKCETTSSIVKFQQSNPDIICDASFGGCFSGNGCAIYTEYQTSCVNECTGDSTVESYRSDPVWQDGFCDEVDIDTDQCGKTRCIDMQGNFALVHDCTSNNIINGVPQTFPVVIMGGKGSCASNGYQPVNPDSVGNNGNSSNRDSILQAIQDSVYSNDCLLFGRCPSTNDSIDFSDPENRSPQNDCYCEYIDNMGVVTCPDGSTQILGVYVHCDTWENHFSSSSTPSSSPSSSDSQSSESGGGGSSGADSRPTDWANWSQANEMNDKLDVNNSFLMSISNKLSNIFSWFTSSGASVSRDTSTGLGSIDWDSPVFVDSSYLYDTTSYSVFNDVADSLFSLAQQNKGLIDTTSIADVDNCFTCRFNFTKNLGGQSVEINFGSLGGFNICRLLRSVLIILTEIACLLMLFSSFIKGGKS